MRTCYLQTIYEDNCYLSTRTICDSSFIDVISRVCSSQVFSHVLFSHIKKFVTSTTHAKSIRVFPKHMTWHGRTQIYKHESFRSVYTYRYPRVIKPWDYTLCMSLQQSMLSRSAKVFTIFEWASALHCAFHWSVSYQAVYATLQTWAVTDVEDDLQTRLSTAENKSVHE